LPLRDSSPEAARRSVALSRMRGSLVTGDAKVNAPAKVAPELVPLELERSARALPRHRDKDAIRRPRRRYSSGAACHAIVTGARAGRWAFALVRGSRRDAGGSVGVVVKGRICGRTAADPCRNGRELPQMQAECAIFCRICTAGEFR
jgi:hypothetical protein